MEIVHVSDKGTEFTTVWLNGSLRVSLNNPRVAVSKRVELQQSGVFHSADGQVFETIADVADSMRWAL